MAEMGDSRADGFRPTLSMHSEIRMCGQNVVDLTAGCSFGCVYCPFAEQNERRHGVSRPTLADRQRWPALLRRRRSA
jgi:DNA repair photolyase